MRTRILGSLAMVLGSVGAAEAQMNVYPNPEPLRPAFAPKPAPKPWTADQPQAAQQAGTQSPPAVNWYPNPSPYPLQQSRADGAAPMAPAPAPQVAPAAPPAATQDCPDPRAPYMQDVAQSCDTCSTDCLCGPPGRIWFGAEYLRWTTRGNSLPPLLTTSPVGTPRAVAGTIGDPGTTTLLGGNNANNNWRSGLRIYGGIWLDEQQTCGIEAGFFFLGRSNYNATIGSNGSQILTRPYTDNVQFDPVGNASAVDPFANAELVSFPGVVAGSATVSSSTDFLGFGANLTRNLSCSPNGRLDWLLGYRFLFLKDSLTIEENLTGLAGSDFPGVNFLLTDSFQTKNYFNGVNGGFNYERRMGRLYFGMRTTVALGITSSVVDIDGSTQVRDVNGTVTTFPGGLLALPSNMGQYTSNNFSVVPEIGMKLGMQVTDHIRVFAGYNYLYWSNVLRTGGVIDTRVNASQLPPTDGVVGAVYPRYEPSRTNFSTHGIMAGLEFRY